MSTIKDLACDVGLMPRTDEFQNFIKDVSDILKYGLIYDDIDKDWIVSLCETSQLTIAKDVLYECASVCSRSTPAWWEVYYNEKVLKRSQKQSPRHKRRPEASPRKRPLPKGRQLQEKRRKTNERRVQRRDERRVQRMNEAHHSPHNNSRRRTMDLEFTRNDDRTRRQRRQTNYQSPSASDVPRWPGRAPSPYDRRGRGKRGPRDRHTSPNRSRKRRRR
jgi:hypothetical protein